MTHHLNNSPPVLSDLRQVERLGEVDKIENVLLETRSTETLRHQASALGEDHISRLTTDALRNFGPIRESFPTA